MKAKQLLHIDLITKALSINSLIRQLMCKLKHCKIQSFCFRVTSITTRKGYDLYPFMSYQFIGYSSNYFNINDL
jgi:hypothetical protein